MSEQANRLPVDFRPAAASDWPFVERIVAETWDGDDYITEALWTTWLGEADSYLAVGTVARRIVVLGRVSPLGPAEWWLEGLRVHPKGQGQGLGDAMMEHLVEWFKRHGDGILRMSTFSQNEASGKLAQSFGFRQILSYRRMEAPAVPADYHGFKLLEPHNADLVDSFLRRSPMFRVNHFAEHYWHLRYLTTDRIRQYLADDTVEVMGWRQGDQLAGLGIVYHEPPPGRNAHDGVMDVGYLDAGDDTTVRAMVQALQGLAASRGQQAVQWKMPTGMGLERAVSEVGMEPNTDWGEDGALLLFERPIRV